MLTSNRLELLLLGGSGGGLLARRLRLPITALGLVLGEFGWRGLPFAPIFQPDAECLIFNASCRP